MSPRRRIDVADRDYFEFSVEPKQPLRWGLPITAMVTGLIVALAIAASLFMVVGHESQRRTQVRDAAALDNVRGFMTAYTTLDPFHANAYADRILAQGTGDFATQFKGKMNEILVQVARAEPTTGTVLDAGVQRWNDNGSADVLVAVKVATSTPDGKSTVESGSRWVVTTVEEGQQWKISQLIQVI
jgi:Mce-associated membrane protein